MDGESATAAPKESAQIKLPKFPLVVRTDMNAEMREEAVDICVTAVERHPGDFEKCTQMVKDAMDKKFAPPWHAVAGQYFAFEVTHEVKNMLYCFLDGSLGLLLWKL